MTIYIHCTCIPQCVMLFSYNAILILYMYIYRWNMAIDEKVYTESRARSLRRRRQNDQIHAMFTWDRPPLFHIELENIVLDELHLLLRIGDVLIRNLILFADSSDHRSKAHRGVVTSHIKELEAAIQSCGVSFQIQQKREANGKPIPDSYEWTALTRKHKQLVLKRLHEKMSTLLPSQLCQAVAQLRKVGLVIVQLHIVYL